MTMSCVAMATVPALLALPDSLLLTIFERLSNLEDLKSLFGTCRDFRALLSQRCSDRLWHDAFKAKLGWLLPERVAGLPSRLAVVRLDASLCERATITMVGGSSSCGEVLSYPLLESSREGMSHILAAPSVPLWTSRTEALATARDCAGRTYAVGGWRHHAGGLGSALRTCEMCEAQGQSWIQLEPQMTDMRAFPGAACVDGWTIMAVGGGTGPFVGAVCHSTTELFDPARDAWRPGPAMLARRCGLAVAHHAGRNALFSIGGYGGGLEYHASVEVLALGASGGRGWMRSPPMSTSRSGHSAAVGPDGRIFVVGGTADGSTMAASGEAFDPRTGHWAKIAPMPFGRGFHGASFGIDGRYYVIGGDKSGAHDDLDGMPDGARADRCPSAAVDESSAELIGTPSRTLFAYDPRIDTWFADGPDGGLGYDRSNFCVALQLEQQAEEGLIWSPRPHRPRPGAHVAA